MKSILIVALVAVACGGCASYWQAYDENQRQQQERLRSLGPAYIIVPSQPEPGVFDYATGKKPTCTSPTGYGTGC